MLKHVRCERCIHVLKPTYNHYMKIPGCHRPGEKSRHNNPKTVITQ